MTKPTFIPALVEKDDHLVLIDDEMLIKTGLCEKTAIPVVQALQQAEEEQLVTLQTLHEEDGRIGLRIKRTYANEKSWDEKYPIESNLAIRHILTPLYSMLDPVVMIPTTHRLDSIEITNPLTLASLEKAGLEVQGLSDIAAVKPTIDTTELSLELAPGTHSLYL